MRERACVCFVCVCLCICECLHVVCAHVGLYISSWFCACVFLCIYAYVHTRVHTYSSRGMCVCTYTHTRTRIHALMHTHTQMLQYIAVCLLPCDLEVWRKEAVGKGSAYCECICVTSAFQQFGFLQEDDRMRAYGLRLMMVIF